MVLQRHTSGYVENFRSIPRLQFANPVEAENSVNRSVFVRRAFAGFDLKESNPQGCPGDPFIAVLIQCQRHERGGVNAQ